MDWGRNDDPRVIVGAIQFSKKLEVNGVIILQKSILEGMQINKEVWMAEYMQKYCPFSTLFKT